MGVSRNSTLVRFVKWNRIKLHTPCWCRTFTVLSTNEKTKISWLYDEERQETRGLVCRFPHCIGFVDRAKQKAFRF